ETSATTDVSRGEGMGNHRASCVAPAGHYDGRRTIAQALKELHKCIVADRRGDIAQMVAIIDGGTRYWPESSEISENRSIRSLCKSRITRQGGEILQSKGMLRPPAIAYLSFRNRMQEPWA